MFVNSHPVPPPTIDLLQNRDHKSVGVSVWNKNHLQILPQGFEIHKKNIKKYQVFFGFNIYILEKATLRQMALYTPELYIPIRIYAKTYTRTHIKTKHRLMVYKW